MSRGVNAQATKPRQFAPVTEPGLHNGTRRAPPQGARSKVAPREFSPVLAQLADRLYFCSMQRCMSVPAKAVR